MKYYTDIEQSKKLAEILPIESADMFWDMAEPDKRRKPLIGPISDYYDMEGWAIPCWSLAALLDVLPTIDNDEFEPQLHRSLDKYSCIYDGEEDSSGLFRVANNPVDACYAMIIKLHELKLL